MTTHHHNRSTEFAKHAEQFKTKVSDLGEEAQNLSHITKKLAGDTLDFISENASDYYKQGLAGAQKAEKVIENKIKSSPMKAILIATGVGLVLGALWKSRK